jgi:hypothetical protein
LNIVFVRFKSRPFPLQWKLFTDCQVLHVERKENKENTCSSRNRDVKNAFVENGKSDEFLSEKKIGNCLSRER